jgi:L-ascorbate metabolism protein UlaG (beta-lactamase superfamily)
MPPPPPPGTASGDRLTWVGHATVLLELGGRRLLTDPVLRSRVGPLARAGAGADPAVAQGLDAVLVSHLHLDHLDARSLRRIDGATPVIAPRGAADLVERLGFTDVTELGIGDTVDVGGVGVRAVPAHHDGRRHPLGARADTIGFVVGADRRVYFAGDTELFDGMAGLDDDLDVALLPIAGWGPTLGPGHLGPREAAVALTRLRPRVAVPIHWGTLYPLGLRFRRERVLADPPAEFARHAADVAPEVDVRVLAPGEALSLD